MPGLLGDRGEDGPIGEAVKLHAVQWKDEISWIDKNLFDAFIPKNPPTLQTSVSN